ncbi:MAG: type I restriction enzyme HsdR N-terminal domain-containing protein [Bacteroidetes bacterium]|nr:MAG: type I restriction enzyme HsdR N-terminal domain-containing protein [Bacteroidota bacterium]
MIDLNLPKYNFKLIRKDGKIKIWDEFRQKFVILTPEEWVRQNFLTFLTKEKHYPKGLVKLEHALKLNGLSKRCDALIYGKNGKPVMIIEFKKPDVKITQEVFNQIGRYNWVMKVPYLIISNGLVHYFVKVDFKRQTFSFEEDILDYSLLEY